MVRITNAKLMEKYEEVSRRLDGHDDALKQIQVSIAELKAQNEELSEGIKLLLTAHGKKVIQPPGSSYILDILDSEGKIHLEDEEAESSKMKNDQGYQLVNRMTKLEFPSFDGEAFKDWHYKCNQFFELDNTPENMKIRLVSIHLKGRALQWHQGFMSEMEGKTLEWKQYLAELREQFVEGIVSKPLIELRNLKLTTNVSEYNSKFNALRNQVVVPSEILLDLYIGGLRNEIMHTVQLMDPKTLNQAMRLARIQEGAYYALWGLEPPKTPNYNNDISKSISDRVPPSKPSISPAPTSLPAPNFLPSVPPNSTNSTGSPYSKPLLSQISPKPLVESQGSTSQNMQTKTNPLKQLSRSEYDEKRRNNQCFFCNEKYVPGHKCRDSKLYMLISPGNPEEYMTEESINEGNGGKGKQDNNGGMRAWDQLGPTF